MTNTISLQDELRELQERNRKEREDFAILVGRNVWTLIQICESVPLRVFFLRELEGESVPNSEIEAIRSAIAESNGGQSVSHFDSLVNSVRLLCTYEPRELRAIVRVSILLA